MERIKQALEQARKEQQNSGRDNPGLRLAQVRNHPASKQAEKFDYTETRVITPDPALWRKNRVIMEDDNDQVISSYKLLRTQIEQRMLAKQWNVLAITSPGPDHGKTLTAINLAISLAKAAHHTVMLVDLDLRKPSIHTYLGVEPENGIYECLADDIPLKNIMFNPGIDRLVVVPGKDPVYNSSEMLASPKMARLVNELKHRYPSRYIIFDLPPVLAADDAMAFAPYVDATMLVVEDDVTTKDQLKQTLEMLHGTNIIGTVLNKSKHKAGSYYYYYY